MSLQAARKSPVTDGQSPSESVEKKQQDKAEFEKRLKEAEETTAMEQGAGLSGARSVTNPGVGQKVPAAPVIAGSPADESTSAAIKKSSSWKFWSRSKDS
jgi:hypothetical protein